MINIPGNHDLEYREMVNSTKEIKTYFIEKGRLPRFDDLIDYYHTTGGYSGSSSIAILQFSNWLECKVKEDHSLCLVFPLKEMLALIFVMESVHEIKHDWHREIYISEEDFKKYGGYRLVGGWLY